MDHRPLRRAQRVAVAALLVVALGTIVPAQSGSALGTVIALTPYEVTTSVYSMENPAVSGRGASPSPARQCLTSSRGLH